MVREIRVKEYRFAPVTPTSGASGAGIAATYSDFPLNGDLLEVEWKTNTTGSMFIITSGTSEVLWSRIAPSGAVVQQSYPLVYADVAIGTTGSPHMVTNRVINDKIVFTGSGYDGGSIQLLVVKYR